MHYDVRLLYILLFSVNEENLGSLVSPFITVIHGSLAGYRPGKIVIGSRVSLDPVLCVRQS